MNMRSPVNRHRLWQVVADAALIVLAWELSWYVRFDGTWPRYYDRYLEWDVVALVLGIMLPIFIAFGFYISDAALTAWASSFGAAGKTDIAALPLLLLTMGAVSLVLMPLRNALSRSHERRADRYALRMTRNLEAFVTAMKRLSAQNLAEEEPSKLVETLFHSHPSISARISAARSFKLDPA